MRWSLFISLLLLSCRIFSQQLLAGQVLDSITHQPLPFVSIGCVGNSNGTMSNEEGRFVLRTAMDCQLSFHLLGYRPKKIQISLLSKGSVVYMVPSTQTLKEVVVQSNDEALYLTVLSVRKVLLNTVADTARCYFLLGTQVNAQPVELLEMYYNAYWSKGTIYQLRFKNGRAALAPHNERYFMSKNHSSLFKAASMTQAHTEMPVHPLQCSARDLRRHFVLSLSLIESGGEVYRLITFKPRKNNLSYCEGMLWLQQMEDVPVKYVFKAHHTPRHPFQPWIKGEASIEGVDFEQEWHFKLQQNNCVPYRATIAYDYKYNWLTLQPGKGGDLAIHTTLNAFFYDYEQVFIEPVVIYDDRMYDYRKIAGLTWNEQFWMDQHSMVTARSTQQLIKQMLKEGVTINYGGDKVTTMADNRFLMKDLHVLWDHTKRLNVVQVSGDEAQGAKERFHLNAQVYMDLNRVNGQLQWKTATIFDLYHSWCYLENTPLTRCFMNIYFDLFECARLELESQLKPTTKPEEAKQLYATIMNETNQLAERYLNEVRMGLNEEALNAWNEVIKKQLNIDNVQLFEVYKH